MSSLQIRYPEKFAPLLEPARYKGAHGGRGSGKSHGFANLSIDEALAFPGNYGEGLRLACVREVQKSLKDSAKLLIEDKLRVYGLGSAQGFKVYEKVISLPKDGIVTFDGMQDHTAESFKSKEGFHRAWLEEGHSFSQKSLDLLRPTIRAENTSTGMYSEIWASWNPNRPTDPIDQLLRSDRTPSGAKVIQINWSDNPWFPKVLEQERLDCKRDDPEKYGHIWEGEYARVFAGAYYADLLERAEAEGRIGFVAADPLLPYLCYWDIGGTGRRADATAIWVVQRVGEEIRVLDYYEASGQPLSEHVGWLRRNGYGEAKQFLPHDGRNHEKVHKITYQSALRDAGFNATVCDNMGAGAAMKRVEAVRRILPRCRFDRDKTQGGRDALGWYHEKRDEVRGIGLGPEHDFSSHAADAFGQMAAEQLQTSAGVKRKHARRALKGVA